METTKVALIAGTILGGGGLTGLAIKYFPSGEKSESISEESTQPQPSIKKKYNPRKITKEEADDYKIKLEKWTKDNGDCSLNIRMQEQDLGAENFSKDVKLDLDGLEEALKKDEAKNKCSSNPYIVAEKGEDGEWNFYDEATSTQLSIIHWSETNGKCKIQIENSEKQIKDVDSINQNNTLGEVLTYLTGDEKYKQSCKQKTEGKTTLLIFKKDDDGAWEATTSTIDNK